MFEPTVTISLKTYEDMKSKLESNEFISKDLLRDSLMELRKKMIDSGAFNNAMLNSFFDNYENKLDKYFKKYEETNTL